MTRLATSFSKFNNSSPHFYPAIFCTASWCCTKAATIRILIQSNPTTLSLLLLFQLYFSTRPSTNLSQVTTPGRSPSILKPLLSSVSLFSSETRYLILNSERRYRIIYFAFRSSSSHFQSPLHHLLDIHIRGTEHRNCNESSFVIYGLLVHAFTGNSPANNGRFHVLLHQSYASRIGYHSAPHSHLSQVVIILKSYI